MVEGWQTNTIPFLNSFLFNLNWSLASLSLFLACSAAILADSNSSSASCTIWHSKYNLTLLGLYYKLNMFWNVSQTTMFRSYIGHKCMVILSPEAKNGVDKMELSSLNKVPWTYLQPVWCLSWQLQLPYFCHVQRSSCLTLRGPCVTVLSYIEALVHNCWCSIWPPLFSNLVTSTSLCLAEYSFLASSASFLSL